MTGTIVMICNRTETAMVEFFILRGVKRGEEWLWQATHDEHAAHAPFKLEQYVGADGGTRWDVRNANGDAVYTGFCYAHEPLALAQDRCVPLTWSASPHQESESR